MGIPIPFPLVDFKRLFLWYITSAELRAFKIIWGKEHQKKFDEKRLTILTNDLNLIYDDDNLEG